MAPSGGRVTVLRVKAHSPAQNAETSDRVAWNDCALAMAETIRGVTSVTDGSSSRALFGDCARWNLD